MSLSEVIIEGTLQPDGTLQLDQKPNVAPGRVKVILQPAQVSAARQGGLVDTIDEIHRGQQARGFSGRSAEEIDAGRRQGEAEYEEKIQLLRSQTTSKIPVEPS
jgi:hypothetical protein